MRRLGDRQENGSLKQSHPTLEPVASMAKRGFAVITVGGGRVTMVGEPRATAVPLQKAGRAVYAC